MKMSYVGSIFLKLGATKTLCMTCFYPAFEYHLTNKKFKRKDFHHRVPGSISMNDKVNLFKNTSNCF